MKKFLFLIIILITHIKAHAQTPSTIALKDSARIFGEGTVSTGDFVFNASFTPNGNTVYFSKATINWNYIAIFFSEKTASGWSAQGKRIKIGGSFRRL